MIDEDIYKVAVDALYNAREAGKVMDEAAEAVAVAVLGKAAQKLDLCADEQDNSQRRLGYRNSAILCREMGS